MRRAATFLLLVAAITAGLLVVYKARAALDARAAFYAEKATARSPEAQPMSEDAATAILLGVDAKTPVSEPPPVQTPSRDARADDRGQRDERRDVTSSIDDNRGVDSRFTTIYIHRGADPPSAHVVPRE